MDAGERDAVGVEEGLGPRLLGALVLLAHAAEEALIVARELLRDGAAGEGLQLLELGAGVQLEAGEQALDHVAVAVDEQLQALAGLGEGQVALGALEVDQAIEGLGRAVQAEQLAGRREEQALEVEVAVGRAEAVVVAAGDAALQRRAGDRARGDEAAAELEVGEGVRGEFDAGSWDRSTWRRWTTGRRRRSRRTGRRGRRRRGRRAGSRSWRRRGPGRRGPRRGP
jgi:hypothetical protein